jgi:predicted nucleic acid-binding protein
MPLDRPVDPSLCEILDAGEGEAIALALLLQTDFILIDERKGRAEAERLGLQPIGALGLIVKATRLGVVEDPVLVLAQLRACGFRVSKRLITEFERLLTASQP